MKQGANPCSGSRREWLLDDGNSCADGLNRTHGATATIADARALRGDLYLKLQYARRFSEEDEKKSDNAGKSARKGLETKITYIFDL